MGFKGLLARLTITDIIVHSFEKSRGAFMSDIALVFGTRPEAVKLAPIWIELKARGHDVHAYSIGQHCLLLKQTLDSFGLTPSENFEVMVEDQSPESVLAAALVRLKPYIKHDLVVVQGDATSALAGALSAFLNHVPVAHVEAGLRSYDKVDPFPEEMNRILIDDLSDLYFVPTHKAAANLRREGVAPELIHIVGNTELDAWRLLDIPSGFDQADILITLHRREFVTQACEAVAKALPANANVKVLVHPNPTARKAITDNFGNMPNVELLDPMPYLEFATLLQGSRMVITDSGGLQELASFIHKPYLVVRAKTERQEGIEAGCGRLVGLSSDAIKTAIEQILSRDYGWMSRCESPFGDGHSAVRIVDAIEAYLGGG